MGCGCSWPIWEKRKAARQSRFSYPTIAFNNTRKRKYFVWNVCVWQLFPAGLVSQLRRERKWIFPVLALVWELGHERLTRARLASGVSPHPCWITCASPLFPLVCRDGLRISEYIRHGIGPNRSGQKSCIFNRPYSIPRVNTSRHNKAVAARLTGASYSGKPMVCTPRSHIQYFLYYYVSLHSIAWCLSRCR